YDAIAADIAGSAGKATVIAGEVVEARVTGHQTIALVSSARGCANGPCLARGDDVERQDDPRGRGGLRRPRTLIRSAFDRWPERSNQCLFDGRPWASG